MTITQTNAVVNSAGDGTSSNAVTGDSGTSYVNKASKELGKDDFLKLLTTQLRFQDPLSPMDNTQFIAQLAQFQSLEGTNNIEQAITALNESFKTSVEAQKKSADLLASAAAISLIGKNVRMQMKEVSWNAAAGEKEEIPVYLGSHTEATVQIKDTNGAVVRTLTTGNKNSNNVALATWNGMTDQGTKAAAGTYSVYIVGEEQDKNLYAFAEGKVDGVSNRSGTIQLRIGNAMFDLSTILDISSGISV